MPLNKLEIQNLRHLIGSHETASKKLDAYSQVCSDPQLKQMFQQSAQSAEQTKQKLLSFLQ
jgi:truncated hemoglobin YjbI